MWGAEGWLLPAVSAYGLSLSATLIVACIRSSQVAKRGRPLEPHCVKSLLYFLGFFSASLAALVAGAMSFIYVLQLAHLQTADLVVVLFGLAALQSLVLAGLNGQGHPHSWVWLPLLILAIVCDVFEGWRRVHAVKAWTFTSGAIGVSLLIIAGLYAVFFYAALFLSIFAPKPKSATSERSPLLINAEESEQLSMRRVPNDAAAARRDESNTIDYGWIANAMFLWVKPLLALGAQRPLLFADLLPLPPTENTAAVATKFRHAISSRTLFSALNSVFGLAFYPLALWKLSADTLGFVGPLLLNQLVLYVQASPQGEDKSEGYIWAALLSLTVLGQAFASTQYTFAVQRVALRLRAALTTAVYGKTLRIGSGDRTTLGSGELTNLMSTDVDRVTNVCPSFHEFWSLPLQIVVCLYLLHSQIGISFLAGLGFALALIPLNRYIANKIQAASEQMMTEKDARVQLTSEVLSGMRLLKYLGWEHRFVERITSLRTQELRHLATRKYLDAWCVFFWACTPVLITSVTLGVYLILHRGSLPSAATLFTSLALFNMLIGPLNAFPWVVNGLVEAYVSHKRIARLLALSDRPPLIGRRAQDPPLAAAGGLLADGAPLLELKTASFEFPNAEQGSAFKLSSISLRLSARRLTVLLGSVGSGKSALLHALVGEMNMLEGGIQVYAPLPHIGLAMQDSWLEGGTAKENVQFSNPENPPWLATVLAACGLTHLVDAEVGPGGARLSGGERARVALARTVYSRPRLALLDDVLASLDPPLARKVFSEAIVGLLRDQIGSSVVFATNQLELAAYADLVAVVDKGEVVFVGSYADLQRTPHLERLGASVHKAKRAAVVGEQTGSIVVEEKREEDEQKVPEEERTVAGELAKGTYKAYALAMGSFVLSLVVVTLLLMQSSRTVSDWWLSFWITRSGEGRAPLSLFGGVYLGLAVANALFTLARSFSFAYAGLCAAEKMHAVVLRRVLNAPLSFFIATPVGRILNRLSSDVWAVDDELPFIANILAASLVALLCIGVLLAAATPGVLLLYIPTGILYGFVQRYYRRTSREVKRLDSASRSPVYSHFSQSLLGATTLAAFAAERANERLLDVNQQAIYASVSIAGWLTAHLQMLGAIVVSGVAFSALLQHHLFPSSIAPALVGLAVAYALPVTGVLNNSITSFTETEKQMIAVERLEEYSRLPSEADSDAQHAVPEHWPLRGDLEFDSLSVLFEGGAGLRQISMRIEGGTRVGVCGRSGAGKTTLLNSIFRIALPTSGQVLIDRIPIDRLSLRRLRSALCIVPQQPFLFKGTVRFNLDPFDHESDNSIWVALEKAHMRAAIAALPGGLSAKIEERGSNLSAGQRQLLCLARAILIQAKIVCVDEATANVDPGTDALVQQTLASEFKNATVIIIAHRIHTLMGCDNIAVLENGALVEFDKPERLSSPQWCALSGQ